MHGASRSRPRCPTGLQQRVGTLSGRRGRRLCAGRRVGAACCSSRSLATRRCSRSSRGEGAPGYARPSATRLAAVAQGWCLRGLLATRMNVSKTLILGGGGMRVIPLKGDESGSIGNEINEAGLPKPRNLFILFYIFWIRRVAGSRVQRAGRLFPTIDISHQYSFHLISLLLCFACTP